VTGLSCGGGGADTDVHLSTIVCAAAGPSTMLPIAKRGQKCRCQKLSFSHFALPLCLYSFSIALVL
jgi:hypothetical protein